MKMTELQTVNNAELAIMQKSTTEIVEMIKREGMNPVIDEIKLRMEMFKELNLNPASKKDREEMRSFAHSISRSKTHVSKIATETANNIKAQAADILAKEKAIKDEVKAFNAEMDSFRDEAKREAVEWDNNEKIRIQAHTDKIAQMKSQVTSVNEFGESLPSSTLINVLGKFEVFKAEKLNAEHCEEFLSEYEQLVNDAIDKFNNEFVLQAKKREQDEAELQALREKQAQQEAQELADKRERAAKLKAEQDLADEKERNKQREAQLILDAENKLKQDAIDAENREKQAVIDAENAEKKRLADIETARVNAGKEMLAKQAEEKRIADEKAANHEHQRKINREALDSMVAEGYSEGEAKSFLKLIIGKKIKNVSVNY